MNAEAQRIHDFLRVHVQRYHLSRGQFAVPEFWEALNALYAGDATKADWGISYLELHPYHIRSGYTRNDLMRALRRLELTAEQRERLVVFIFQSVDRGGHPRSKELNRLARRLDCDELRDGLVERLQNPNPEISRHAGFVLEHCRLNDSLQDWKTGAPGRVDNQQPSVQSTPRPRA
jgi:hypothetical protein